jgi:tetratricopeptide (TPR) repeat protein
MINDKYAATEHATHYVEADDDDEQSLQERQAAWRLQVEGLADEVLEAYARWDGCGVAGEALARLHPAIVPWSPVSALALIQRAVQAARGSRDAVEVLALIDAAFQLDPALALEGYYPFKSEKQVRQGRRASVFACKLYDLGCELGSAGAVADALRAYQAAAQLDPGFLWPDNNYAWLLATSPSAPAELAATAVPWSLRACAMTGWSYWAFLGTLAASYAAAGDFRRAIAWQQVSGRLAPREHRDDSATSLKRFETNQPLRDPGYPPAAGEVSASSEAGTKGVDELRGALKCLLTLPTEVVR